MGLDMYLSAERYMSEVLYPGDDATINAISGLVPEIGKDHKVKTLVVEVGYWRKVNAIHKWFVDNVQDGEDDCQKAYVERASMEDLLAVVKEVLADPSKASDLLPPERGFFFGSNDIDDWYTEGLESTKAILESVLNDSAYDKRWDFYYQSSW